MIALASLSATYAVYRIVSPTITVTVQDYSLAISSSSMNPMRYQNITLSGYLTSVGNVAVNNRLITLYQNRTQISTTFTDSSGYFEFQVNMTQRGAFDYYAEYTP
jgi:hypothetical protein